MSNSGLPELKSGEKRTLRIRDIRVSPRERRVFEINVEASGLTHSEYVRMKCCAEVDPIVKKGRHRHGQ